MGNSKSQSHPQKPAEAPVSVRKRPKITRDHVDTFPDYTLVSPSRPGSFYPHSSSSDSLTFHDTHGVNIIISHGGKVASRANSFCYAIAFTSRPIRVEERVRVCLKTVDNGWSGVMRFGYTVNDPAKLQPRELPRYACPDLTNQPGYWAKALPVRFAQENNILSFYVSTSGCVFYAINNKLEGIILEGVNVSRPVWGLFDIYGNTTSLKLLNEDGNSLQPSLTRLFHNPVQLPSNMERDTRRKLDVDGQIAPICFSATMGSAVKCRNRVHLTRKDHVIESAVAFTDTALRPGQTVYFYCAEAKHHTISTVEMMGFGVGVTTCDPTSIIIAELPFDAQMLIDRSEYWVFFRDFEAPPEGEYFAFSVEKEGCISYIREGIGKSLLFHVDTSLPLYFVMDLNSTISSVAIVGMSTVPDIPNDLRLGTSSNISAMHSLFDFSSSDPAGSLNFLDVNSVFNRSLSQDREVAGPSCLRENEPTTSSYPEPGEIMPANSSADLPSGVYPHGSRESRISPGQIAVAAVAAAPVVASALSWISNRVASQSSSSNEAVTEQTNSELSFGSGEGENVSADEDNFYNAQEEPGDASGSDDSSMEQNLRILDTLRDLDDILQPLELGDGAIPLSGGAVYSGEGLNNESSEVKSTSSEEKSSGGGQQKECVMCCDSPVNAVIYSCGHACLCFDCGQIIMGQPSPTCPLCRARVKDIIRLYQA